MYDYNARHNVILDTVSDYTYHLQPHSERVSARYQNKINNS